jgi:simple sugar transport system ATP-binding protein
LNLIENAFLSAHLREKLVRWGLIDFAKTRTYAQKICETFDVRTSGVDAEASSLSGGNLQKFIIGREILQRPSLMIAAQPTWGVDAGAAAAIHQALIDLAASGTAVLVVSQELDELFAITDRIAVMSAGHLSAARSTRATTLEEIGLLMGGDGRRAEEPITHVA